MTSRLGRLSAPVQIILATALIALPASIPHLAAAQTDTKPFVLEIKNIPRIPSLSTINNLTNNSNQTPLGPNPAEVQKAKDEQNSAILTDYLSSKGSPLAPYASDILQHDNWKLVLAISNGESTLCKHQLYNNCWGVGGAWNLRRYNSLSTGFSDVDRLLREKYIPTGADTPKEIVRKYVGSYSPTWVYAVSQTLDQLNQLALVN